MNHLTIKNEEDKLTVAKILVKNGYTVKIITVADEKNKKIKVLAYGE